MAQVHPFRAFRYNPAIAPFDRVLTQPYDKISAAMQEKYYAADPHNLITLEKGRVKQRNFHDYPMLRMNEMPEVEAHIVPSTDKMGGVGEPGVPTVAPAVTPETL